MPSKLGQNFLKNKDVVKRIINSANLTKDDVVLEIGPGKGILTEELAKVCKKVIAIEIDRELFELIRKKFSGNDKVEIINEDFLKINLNKLIKSNLQLPITNYKVVANLPYYITSPIIRLFLEADMPPKEMILMVQKEVAERVVSVHGNHSILSLSVQYYGKPDILFQVSKDNFDPVPEVDSALIKIATNKRRQAAMEGTESFFRVVRAGFCAKRKTLVNNLVNSFHLEKNLVEEKLKAVGILPTARAQELDIEKWKKISKLL